MGLNLGKLGKKITDILGVAGDAIIPGDQSSWHQGTPTLQQQVSPAVRQVGQAISRGPVGLIGLGAQKAAGLDKQLIGGFVSHLPGQVKPAANFVNNNIISPQLTSFQRVGGALAGQKVYDPGMKGIGQIVSDTANIASLGPIGTGVKGANVGIRALKTGALTAPIGIASSVGSDLQAGRPINIKDAALSGTITGATGGAITAAPTLARGAIKGYKNSPTLSSEVGAIRVPQVSVKTPPVTTLGKESQFTSRIKESPTTPAAAVPNIGASYGVKPNKVTLKNAVDKINQNPDAAYAHILSNDYKPTAENHATAMLLAEQARTSGNIDKFTAILNKVGSETHNPAQALQILSQWGKSTPEGVVRYATRVKPSPITSGEAGVLTDWSTRIGAMPEGRPKLLETAKMLKYVENLNPANAGNKLSNVLYYAQLLNPKTAIRNVVGNTIFNAGENVSDVGASALDKAKSLVTGKPRSVYAPDIAGQIKAGQIGAKEAGQEAKAGVNLSGLSGQTEAFNQRATAFNNPVGRALDRGLAYELNVPDRAFFSGAEFQSLKNQLRASGVDKKLLTPENIWLAKQGQDVGLNVTQDMLLRANDLGRYRTFQDNSVPARILTKLKDGLNIGKPFGAGSFVLNYPRTPGNLLARGLDYSPAGFIKTTIDVGKALAGSDLAPGTISRDLSRALVGSAGLVGTGAALNQLGIITGRPDPNKSVNAAEKTLGLGQYKINVTALKRYILSGFDASVADLRPQDTQVSYDWAQPLAFSLTIGANLNQTKGSDKGAVGKISDSIGRGAGQVIDAMNSLAEQPVLQNLTKLTGGSAGVAQGVINTISGAPASFVPTILNQINQLTNNTARSTYDANPINSAIKQVQNKIPGLSQGLQPQVNVLGQPNQRYQGGTNNLFNVFLNPAFVTKYIPNDVLGEAQRLRDATGETKQYPDLVNYTQKVNGKNVQMTPEQVTALQTYVGKHASNILGKLISSPAYQNADDAKKVNAMSNALTAITQAGRAEVLGADQNALTAAAKKILAGGSYELSTKTVKAKVKKVSSGGGSRKSSGGSRKTAGSPYKYSISRNAGGSIRKPTITKISIKSTGSRKVAAKTGKPKISKKKSLV